MEISSSFKQLLEVLRLAIKMYTGFSTDVIWVNTKVCIITSEPTVTDAFGPLKIH